MASKSRRSTRLAKDDKNEDSSNNLNMHGRPRTKRSSLNNVAPNTNQDSFNDNLFDTHVDSDFISKKKKDLKATGYKKKLNTKEIQAEFDISDEEVYNPTSKNNNTGKKQNNYKSFLRIDNNSIKMRFITLSNQTECVIGAKYKNESATVDNSRKLRRTIGQIDYNEDTLTENHYQEQLKIIYPTIDKGTNNVTIGNTPRKRSKQHSQQHKSENNDVDSNQTVHESHISSPTKRLKSEIEIEQTPKKNVNINIKCTPKSTVKRQILPEEPSSIEKSSRINTRSNSIYNSSTYKEWSSSDDNITRNKLLEKEPRVVLEDGLRNLNKTPIKKKNNSRSQNTQTYESEESEVENKMNYANKNNLRKKDRLKSKSIGTPVKELEKLNLNKEPKTPRSANLKIKINLKKILESRPNNNTPELDIKEPLDTLRRSQRITNICYNIESDVESADSSPNYEGHETSTESEDSSDSGNNSAEEFQTYNRNKKRLRTLRKHPATPKAVTKVTKVSMDTPTKAISRMSLGTPSLDKHRRIVNIVKPSTPLQEARAKLHVSVLPKSLPCREEQFNDIYSFLHARLLDGSGGCIYISGVPGTGKTATVNEVIRCLKKSVTKGELTEFQFVDINAMKLSEPRQAYVQIWKQLSKETKTWEESRKLLDNRFTVSNSKRQMTLLLVDELDLLCTKRQDVVYNLLDWPSKTNAKLVVVTIANTMDLPERILMGKVTSRLGLTRLTFPPYNFKQLEEIVVSRLKGFNAFSGETIQLVARKVASVSGDARRALDICRRATEIAELNDRELVSMIDVKQALDEMIASPKIQAIKHCSDMEKVFLQAVCVEVHRTGLEEVVFKNVYMQMETLCSIDGFKAPNISETLEICARLSSWRLLLCDHSRMDIHQRLLLNVSTDDVHFATKKIDA